MPFKYEMISSQIFDALDVDASIFEDGLQNRVQFQISRMAKVQIVYLLPVAVNSLLDLLLELDHLKIVFQLL